MSKSPLPLECLRIVLSNLAHQGDTHSLSTCLRVNSLFANATLPFLYKNPFLDESHPAYDTQPVRRTITLVRTLLRQAPPEKVTDLLRAFYFDRKDFDDDDELELSSLDLDSELYVHVLHYLPHIKKLVPRDFQFRGRDLNYDDANCYSNSDRLTLYLKDSGLGNKYRRMASGILSDAHQKYLYGLALRQDIELQLGWALCLPETIQDLTIPVTDCQRYLDDVEHLKSLAHIRFTFDGQFHFGRSTSETEVEFTARERALLKERIGHMETMVAFVQMHTQMHRKVLRTANCYEVYIWDDPKRSIYDDYQFRLLKFLPPLYNPTTLDGQNIRQFYLNTEDTNLAFIERISMDGTLSDKKAFLNALSSSLHRCRALRYLNLDHLGDDKDLFQWAIEEKEEYDRQLNSNQTPTRVLIPIESAQLEFCVPRFGPQIDSFIQAFGSSLSSLTINEQYVNQTFEDIVGEPVVCGRQWNLPKMSQLVLLTHLAPLVLHPYALSNCPDLENLHLEDALNGTQVSTSNPSWKAAVLPSLTFLTLRGSPALAFHPDTLNYTPELASLDFSMNHHFGHHVLLPAQELSFLRGEEPMTIEVPAESPTRPIWTWDWYLPVLGDLVMTGEFAFSFQFRMLRQTPLLQRIYLNSRTEGGLHERTITLNELRDETGDGFLNLPQLFEFRLVGRWQVDVQVWKVLFNQIAPNIESLEEGDCFGYGLQDWIEATSALLRLDEAYSSLDVNHEQLVALGLKLFEYMYYPEYAPTSGAKFSFEGGNAQYYRPSPVDSASKEEKEEKEERKEWEEGKVNWAESEDELEDWVAH
ncbi:hypothetical protein EC991_005248 [Linnemannia zychae]|nr:hypothetical protein EC991_005248 [Linnemannia zychae]